MNKEPRVHAINTSAGGVPKRSRPSARVTKDGVEGDRQRNLKHHGGPDRAVCVYSLELIERLCAEGHAIEPGTVGENLTLSGLDWRAVATGTRLEIGEVVLEVTKAAFPCRNLADAFVDGRITRISEKVQPGWSRFYCRVLEEGTVTVGDRVIVSNEPGEVR